MDSIGRSIAGEGDCGSIPHDGRKTYRTGEMMSIAMDGSDESAGCTCDVGLTRSQLEFLRTELTKWLNEQHLTFQPEQWRKGFHEAMRIALANIMLLTEPKIVMPDEEDGDE